MSKEDKIKRELTNEFLTTKFNTDIGQKATVQREDMTNSLSAKANGQLKDIGELLNPVAGTTKYMGSAAVHIYQSEQLEQLFILSQVETLGSTPEITVSKAFKDLQGAMMEHYGRARRILRSGF